MRRPVRRVLMALTGLALFALYALGAYLGYLALTYLWAVRPSPAELLVGLVIATVVLAYLSYRLGTIRLLAGLRAVPVPRDRAPELHTRLDSLVERMDTRRPELRVGSLPAPNVLSIGGRGNGVVVFDAALLRTLSLDEAEAILAHELAHLEGHDVLIQTLAYSALQTIVGMLLFVLLPVTLLATGVAHAIAWIRGHPAAWAETPMGRLRVRISQGVLAVSALVTLGVRSYSRSREYAADERAAEVTGNPAALASALRTIDRLAERPQGLLSRLTVGGDETEVHRLLATHPATDDRIERLSAIAEEQATTRWTTVPVE